MSNNYVVRGRGENKGKYLRLSWGGRPQFTWVPSQKEASRLPGGHENYRGVEWHASATGGYAVLLTAPRSLDVGALKAYIASHAAGATEAKGPAYWVDGADELYTVDAAGELDVSTNCTEGDDFCLACCEAKVEELLQKRPGADVNVDGGFGTDHDSPPYCTTCGVKLDGFLTEYGADEELRALTDECPPSFDDVEGWDAMERALVNVEDSDPVWRKIARVVAAAQAQETSQIPAPSSVHTPGGHA